MVTVVRVGEECFKKAKEMFEKYTDKAWSFTDCTGFALMRELGKKTAFTLGENFKLAGFEIYPLIDKQ